MSSPLPITNFMGLHVPESWVLQSEVNTGNFTLNRSDEGVNSIFTGLSAVQIIRMLKKHWKEVENGQYRSTNQASRSTTSGERSSRNTSGTGSAPSTSSGAGAGQGRLTVTTGITVSATKQIHQQAQTAAQQAGYSVAPGQQMTAEQAAMLQQMYKMQALAQQVVKNIPRAQEYGRPWQGPLPKSESPVIGEFVGYRVWEIGANGVLHSLSYNTVWNPGDVIKDTTFSDNCFGKCDGDKAISDHGSAGVWAFKSPYLLMCSMSNMLRNRNIVYGSIWMWGTVIEHQYGYRSQYASIRSLDHCGDDKTLEQVRHYYKIGGMDGYIHKSRVR